MAVELSTNIDESILAFDQEGFLGSSVLVQMGIKINKPNVETRITELVQRFNETYLETLDFLTQILPLAREQFGRSDNLLLPKTPSKKRHRKIVQDLHNQENCNPNIPPKMPAIKEPPVKRITRRSKRNHPSPVREEPITRKTRNTRSRTKKLEATVDHGKVSFVDESKVQVTSNKISPDKTSQNLSTTNTLKRTSSISPDSVKPVKKKSKSSDELTIDNSNSVIDDDNLPEKQTSTPVCAEPPQVLSLSSIAIEPLVKSTGKLVNITTYGENNEAKLTEKESSDDVATDSKMNENSLPPTEMLVEIGNHNNAAKQTEVIVVADSSPPSNAPPSATVPVEPETAILLKIDETVGKISNDTVAESPKIQKQFSENVVSETQDKIAKMVVDNDMSDETSNNIINVPTTNEEDLIVNTESRTEPMETMCQISSENDTKTLRRIKRLSKQNTREPVVGLLPEQTKEELSTQLNEQTSTKEVEPISDSQDEVPVETAVTVISESPKPVRRSTRLSKRVSKVSTGYSRRSSRRLSCRSGYFKKPLSLKQVEVQLDDVGPGISDFVKSEFSVKKELGEKMLSNTGSEHSSTESEDDAPKMTSALPTNTLQQSSKTDSSSDEMADSIKGRVAGLVTQINRNNCLDERTSLHKTPNGILKIKRIGSAIKASSQKPTNLVGGNVKSFIKRQSVKKLDANEVVRQKKLELQRKEEKEKERKDQAELRRKNWAEEQKRKREEKQKRVAEAKAAREREEQDKKQRQLEERRQMLYASEQAKKKREHEEETKKKLREQRTKEAEARRLREEEERLKRLQEKKEEDKMYRDMLKRKQEMEEQERKQRIQEEKRLHEQKQRERAREKEEERERRLREIKEKAAKRIEKEETEIERKEKEDKEKKQREQEDREKNRICQLIKDKMEQERKMHEQKLQKEEKERREREEQRKREAMKAAMLQNARNADSYLMTPPPAQTRKPPTSENYDISDIRSDESTDDEDAPRKKVPHWAQGIALKSALLQQDEPRRVFEELASGFVPHAPDLEKIFTKKRKRFYQRTSSAHWSSPPIKV